MSKRLKPESPSAQAQEELNASRREFLHRLSAAAAYAPPAITTLVVGESARAHHKPGHANVPNACKNTLRPPFCETLESGVDAGVVESGPATMGEDPFAKFTPIE